MKPGEAIYRLVKDVGFDETAKIVNRDVDWVRKAVAEYAFREDFGFFAENCLFVRTKSGKITHLKPNRGQRKIVDAVKKCVDAGKPIRIKLLKARQFGGSTVIQAMFFHNGIFDSHKQYTTVCHDMDSARNMRAMFNRFYANYKRPKPDIKRVSEKWWTLIGKDSDYIIDTADELDTGRSFTNHRLHASEVAFYRDPETLMVALLQSVPEESDTMVFIESTGNGIGDWFYNFIKADNSYELVFVAWWEIEEYTRAFESEEEKSKFVPDGYEQGLLAQGISLEQLNWRRFTIQNQLNGDELKFQQEYPATVDEAFIASGRPYFPLTKIRQELVRTERLKQKKGYLDWDKVGESVRFSEDPAGWWTVFEEPQGGYEYLYVTGSDAAEGKMVKEASKEPDNSVCRVLNRLTNKEAAAFCGRLDTDLFGNEIHKASVWFKSACECVERNASGLAVIDSLKNKDGIYLYRRELMGKVDDAETVEYGFQTNSASRDSLLSEFRTRVREGKAYQSDDVELWRECLTFVYDSKGKPQAQSGTHDDRVFAAALAVQASLQANDVNPIARPEEKQIRSADSDDDWGKSPKRLVMAEF